MSNSLHPSREEETVLILGDSTENLEPIEAPATFPFLQFGLCACIWGYLAVLCCAAVEDDHHSKAYYTARTGRPPHPMSFSTHRNPTEVVAHRHKSVAPHRHKSVAPHQHPHKHKSVAPHQHAAAAKPLNQSWLQW